MEPELVALASAAGTAVASLLATDAWTAVKTGLSALWHRVHPDRSEAVAADLDEAHRELVAAREAGDDSVAPSLAAEWQARLRRRLAADPSIAAELSRLLFEELAAGREPAVRDQIAVATGGSMITQAGRDITITDAGRARPPSRRTGRPPTGRG